MREKDNRTRLLRKLFRNYRAIRQICDEQILVRRRESEEYYESFEWFERLMEGKDPDKLIEELQKASGNTERLISQIDRAVDEYGAIARKEGMASWREYDALYSRYFSASFSTPEEISKKFGVRKSVIYKDMKHAETRFIAMFF